MLECSWMQLEINFSNWTKPTPPTPLLSDILNYKSHNNGSSIGHMNCEDRPFWPGPFRVRRKDGYWCAGTVWGAGRECTSRHKPYLPNNNSLNTSCTWTPACLICVEEDLKTWHQGLNICSALYIFIIALAVFWHHNPWCTMCVSKVQQNKQLDISFPILYFSSFLQGKNRVVLEVQIEKIWTALNACQKYFAQSSQLTTRARFS